jgi:hypothetical protein
MVLSPLLLFNNIRTLNFDILTTDYKDAIRSLKVVSTPEEYLITHHTFDNSFLVKEWTPSVYDFDWVLHLNHKIFTIPQYLVPVHGHLAVDLAIA